MERDLANILRVCKIVPIEGKDRIELATVENWEVIVEKGECAIGDLVVYCEYDTILPEKPEFEFLRPRCWSKLYEGFRIRNMRMAGVYSQGIVFNVSILPKGTLIKEGANVAKTLGIVKYDPEEMKEIKAIRNNKKYSPLVRWLLRFRICKRVILGKRKRGIDYPATVKKSGETNIQKCYSSVKKQCSSFYVTEKLEGQAATFLLKPGKGKDQSVYQIFSHNAYRDNETASTWKEISDKYGMENILRKKWAVQGEIVGPRIQGNIYDFDDKRFYVYKVTDTETGISLNYDQLVAFCTFTGLDMVPVLYVRRSFLGSVENMLADADGISVLNKRVMREGLIWRSMTDQSIGFKAKSRKFSVWFEKVHGATE